LIKVIFKRGIPMKRWGFPAGCGKMFSVEVKVGLKKGVSDPEGANTMKSLSLLGFQQVKEVKSLKVYRMEVDAPNREEAEEQVEEMCRRLLTNPVIHTHEIIFL
jgi:phosphoribosylformylglycinamidine synthase